MKWSNAWIIYWISLVMKKCSDYSRGYVGIIIHYILNP